MLKIFYKWLGRKWLDMDLGLARDYVITFSSPEGQRVLQHLMDTIYCQVYAGPDPVEAAMLNARRSIVHEILVNIDAGEHPEKYKLRTSEQTLEEMLDGRSDS